MDETIRERARAQVAAMKATPRVAIDQDVEDMIVAQVERLRAQVLRRFDNAGRVEVPRGVLTQGVVKSDQGVLHGILIQMYMCGETFNNNTGDSPTHILRRDRVREWDREFIVKHFCG